LSDSTLVTHQSLVPPHRGPITTSSRTYLSVMSCPAQMFFRSEMKRTAAQSPPFHVKCPLRWIGRPDPIRNATVPSSFSPAWYAPSRNTWHPRSTPSIFAVRPPQQMATPCLSTPSWRRKTR